MQCKHRNTALNFRRENFSLIRKLIIKFTNGDHHEGWRNTEEMTIFQGYPSQSIRTYKNMSRHDNKLACLNSWLSLNTKGSIYKFEAEKENWVGIPNTAWSYTVHIRRDKTCWSWNWQGMEKATRWTSTSVSAEKDKEIEDILLNRPDDPVRKNLEKGEVFNAFFTSNFTGKSYVL